jgi:hypothetical protein
VQIFLKSGILNLLETPGPAQACNLPCLSIRSRETTRLPLEVFSQNLKLIFSKICQEYSSFLKILQK